MVAAHSYLPCDQAFGLIDTIHYVITFIYTSGTVYTFQLCPVANIYPCRTHIYTLKTIYTVAVPQSFPIFVLSELFTPVFTLAPFMVIGHYNGFIVQQHPLQSTVWASDNTYLFPEPCENEIKDRCKNQQWDHSAQVRHRTICNISDQLIATDQIGQEHVGDKEGNKKENTPL